VPYTHFAGTPGIRCCMLMDELHKSVNVVQDTQRSLQQALRFLLRAVPHSVPLVTVRAAGITIDRILCASLTGDMKCA
jgi:hypothetical protein